MKEEYNLKLNIPSGESASNLKNKIFEEELKELNEKSPMEENQINITATYFLKKENTLEVGFFIRNTLSQNISLEVIDLLIRDEKDADVISQQFNLKYLGTIPTYSGTPVNVEFNMPEGFEFNDKESYKLMFSNMGNLKPDLTVTTEIENLPLNISFEEEKEIRDFDNNLKTLKKDAISLDVFKSAITEDKGIEITILFRNGYDKAAKIEKLPITIENFNGLPICKVVFEDSNGLVEVNPRKSKLVKFKIEECKLYTKVFDLDRCKILYK